MAEALEDLRAEIEEAAQGELSPAERAARLGSIREELIAALDEVDARILEATLDPAAPRPLSVELAIGALRARASAAQEGLDSGALSMGDLEEWGITSEAEVARLDEEGLLVALAESLMESGVIDEAGQWVASSD